jgi:hypothetical protein
MDAGCACFQAHHTAAGAGLVVILLGDFAIRSEKSLFR